jgi:iduronate 2-sulfatase
MHYNSHANDKAIVKGDLPPNLSTVPKCEIRDVPDNAYFDGRIAEMAVLALKELKEKEQPFFLAVGFWKPHAHFNAPKKYWDLYKRENIKPPSHPEPPRNVPEIALHDGREICRDFKDRPDGKPTGEDALALRHGYYAGISYVDAQVGKVIVELDRLGLKENTIIVFWSDHGYHLGEHGMWGKTSNFEWDARVPLIIATPWHKPGGRSDALVELLDLYPTLADLCGLAAPQDLEGKSLKPILDDPKARVKQAALTQHCRPAYPANGRDPEAMGYSIRTDHYRYTEWREFRGSKILARELYDHQTDPGETENLADQSEKAEVIARLHEQLSNVVSGQKSK